MPDLLKKALKYAVSIGIAVFLLWLIISTEDPVSLWETIKTANLNWLFVSFGVSILSHLFRAYRWNILMEPLGHSPSLANSFSSVMVGYMVNIVVPRGGEVSRCAMLYKTDDIPVNESFGTVVTERIFDLLTLFTCILLAFLFQFELLRDFVFDSVKRSFGGLTFSSTRIIIAVSAIAISLLLGYLTFRFVHRKFRGSSFFQKVRSFKKGLVNGLLSFRKIRKKWQFLTSTILIWVCYFYMSYSMFFCLSGTSHLGVDAGLAILVLGGLGMSLPAPGGTGPFHYFVSKGLFALFAIPETTGKAYAFIVHGSQMFLLLTSGFIALMFILFVSTKKNAKFKLKNGNLAENNVA